nr:MAG TPA: hypothetical protein [Caudoviricetes sp.]DAQ11109.1 MAG TPA: hypothetical protein [Caudoviricetes sp.]DAZ38981.1 MAG TPA: hypothetical protein [Caudoviricetes sp.]
MLKSNRNVTFLRYKVCLIVTKMLPLHCQLKVL